jgi:hypothetical protein
LAEDSYEETEYVALTKSTASSSHPSHVTLTKKQKSVAVSSHPSRATLTKKKPAYTSDDSTGVDDSDRRQSMWLQQVYSFIFLSFLCNLNKEGASIL